MEDVNINVSIQLDLEHVAVRQVLIYHPMDILVEVKHSCKTLFYFFKLIADQNYSIL